MELTARADRRAKALPVTLRRLAAMLVQWRVQDQRPPRCRWRTSRDVVGGFNLTTERPVLLRDARMMPDDPRLGVAVFSTQPEHRSLA